MRYSADDILFIGTHGHVTALEKRSGETLWSTSLPDTGYDVVALLHEDDTLFAASKGHVFALDPLNGEILWRNGLRGLGKGYMLLATTRSATPEAITLGAAGAAAASALNAGSGA